MMSTRVAAPDDLSGDQIRAAVDWALASRRSVRAFLPTQVPAAVVESILEVARYCASGVNTQPWHVHVVMGRAKEGLSEAIMQVYNDEMEAKRHTEPYDYYPTVWKSPYLERRRQVGWRLYGLLGIDKDNRQGMHAQHGRNYRFFDAPVGLMFTVDRGMGRGSLIDYGMFMQSFMIAARARGLDTCAQAAFNSFHEIIKDKLGIPDDQMLVCGMSLGYADNGCIENTLLTEREAVSAFTTFHESI